MRDFLKSLYFFKTFNPEELQIVEKICEPVKFGPKQTVFKEGNEASAMFLVTIGTVRISKGSDASEIVQIGQGELFGELPFLDGGVRSATATTAEETHLIKIPYTKLTMTLVGNPDLAIKFYEVSAKYVAKRLRSTTEDLKTAKKFLYEHF